MKSWLDNRNSTQKKFHNMANKWLGTKKTPYNVQPPLPFLFVVILFSQPNLLVKILATKNWQRLGIVSGVENSGCAEGVDRNQSGFPQLYHLQLLRAEAGRS